MRIGAGDNETVPFVFRRRRRSEVISGEFDESKEGERESMLFGFVGCVEAAVYSKTRDDGLRNSAESACVVKFG